MFAPASTMIRGDLVTEKSYSRLMKICSKAGTSVEGSLRKKGNRIPGLSILSKVGVLAIIPFAADTSPRMPPTRPSRLRVRRLTAFPVRLAADIRHLDLRQRSCMLGTNLGVAVGALQPDRRDIVAYLVVARASAHQRAQIVAGGREETGVEPAVGGESCARAVAAEGLRHRRNHADLARAVAIAPALGDLARICGTDRLERELAADDREHLRRR